MKNLVTILLLGLIFSVGGCALENDVTNEARFHRQLGRRYVLLKDCYVVQEREVVYFSYKVQSNLTLVPVMSGGFWGLPTSIDPSTFNKWYYDSSKILGVIKAGSIFKTVGVHYLTGLKSNKYLVTFEGGVDSKWGELDAFPIQRLSQTPEISEKDAKPL